MLEEGCAYCLLNRPGAEQERDIPSTQLRRPVRGCSIAIAAPRRHGGRSSSTPPSPLRFGRASIGGKPFRVNGERGTKRRPPCPGSGWRQGSPKPGRPPPPPPHPRPPSPP